MPTLSGSYTTHRHGTHTEYRVRPGGRLLVTLAEADVFENVHINCAARGAHATIVDRPSWQATPLRRFIIRNVAITGAFPDHASGAISVACRDEALIDNVWLGDGCASYPVSGNWNDYPTALLVRPPNSGELTIRRVNAQRWIDNALYCSPPGRPGPGRGRIIVEDSYAAHNQIACFRLGTNDVLRNCTAETKRLDHRGLWVFDAASADVRVIDSQLNDTGAINRSLVVGQRGTARVRNSAWNTEQIAGTLVNDGGNSRTPRTVVPDGCPTSARDAYLGRAAESTTADHVLELGGQFRYRIDHPGVRPHPDHEQWLDRGEAYGPGWAEWHLTGGDGARTRWLIDGDLDDLEITVDEYAGEIDVRTLTIDGDAFEIDLDDADDATDEIGAIIDAIAAQSAETVSLIDRLRELVR